MIPAAEAMSTVLSVGTRGSVVIASGKGDDGAAFSPCESWRYLLWRVWNPELPFWTFGMLNPSTADHMKLDPTITRCVARAKAGGAGGLVVWNLFAWRATDPAAMKRVSDPIGRANDAAIKLAVQVGAVNVAAWGAHGSHREREHAVRAMLGRDSVPLHALAFTDQGHPRHPLYLQAHLEPQPWRYWQ